MASPRSPSWLNDRAIFKISNLPTYGIVVAVGTHCQVINFQLTKITCTRIFHSNPEWLFASLVAVRWTQLTSIVRVAKNLRIKIADNTLRNPSTGDSSLSSVIFGQLPLR